MNTIQGIAIARGIAVGPVFQYKHVEIKVEQREVSDPVQELDRLNIALEDAVNQVQELFKKANKEVAANQASIFEAHQLMLQDPELLVSIRKLITEEKYNAEFAVKEATSHYANILESMGSEYFKSRADDIRDISSRLQRLLLGINDVDTDLLIKPSIIVAMELTPSDTIMLDKENVLGFCIVEGSETSHTAILAKGLNIPAVVSGTREVLSYPNGKEIILDGRSGEIYIDPTDEVKNSFRLKLISDEAMAHEARLSCHEPAITADGSRFEVVANIGNIDDAKLAIDYGAEGIGLLRTEFMYMQRDSLPDQEEQYQSYKEILRLFGNMPVVLRTSDIGGDKEIPYLDMPHELNPFLGVRGLRLALNYSEEILKPQIKAALRAGKGHNLRIMFPMVATLDEIRQARRIVERCKVELLSKGLDFSHSIQLGIMVEVPSVAVMADLFAPEVDFFSIGTNDLTQYTLAVDRTNSRLNEIASAFSPAVLRLIQNVIVQAHKFGKWVGLCGELAGEPMAIPILVGMGLDEFSMNPQAIPIAKQVIRSLNISACKELAEEILKFESANEVKAHVIKKIPNISGI